MKEIWKRIANTEYKISSVGNVYSEKSNKLLRQNDDGHGYLAVSIWVDGMQTKEKVHRLVANAFCERELGQDTVNHIDGIKRNNAVENLEWLSRSDNMRHAWLTELCKKGSETTIAILNEAEVEAIKFLMVEGLSNQEIANQYGVARGTISKIRQLKTWKAVRPDLNELIEDISVPLKKLTGEDIPIIREMHAAGVSLAEIGRKFNVHSGTISGIILGKAWKNY